jgi:hypothetical protein
MQLAGQPTVEEIADGRGDERKERPSFEAELGGLGQLFPQQNGPRQPEEREQRQGEAQTG